MLLRMVAASPGPAAGLRACLRDVQGSMAVALYDRQREVVWLARNRGRPLWLARLWDDRRLFFASADGILRDAFRHAFGPNAPNRVEMLLPLPEDVPLSISPSGRIISR